MKILPRLRITRAKFHMHVGGGPQGGSLGSWCQILSLKLWPQLMPPPAARGCLCSTCTTWPSVPPCETGQTTKDQAAGMESRPTPTRKEKEVVQAAIGNVQKACVFEATGRVSIKTSRGKLKGKLEKLCQIVGQDREERR